VHVLITGGCGFAGSRLALYLSDQGHRVTAMDNLVRRGSETNIERLQRHGVAFVHGDVRNAEDFANLPNDIEFVCDASAQPSVVSGYANPVFDITNNAVGVVRVLQFARDRFSPLIFFSTNRVYSADQVNALPRREGATRLEWDANVWSELPAKQRVRGFDPAHGISEEFSVDGAGHSLYGASKLMADVACQEYGQAFDLPIVVNRLGVISGSGQFGKVDQGWVVWWAIAHSFGLPLKYIGWKGKQVRDVLFIEDVCRLVDLQIRRIGEFRGEVFNVGGGAANALSLVEATQFLERRLGRSATVAHEDMPRKADMAIYITDNRKAERVLGWTPQVRIGEGLEAILSWIGKNDVEMRARYAAGS
jgi:CDP-paratose 2-epimerase